MGGGGHKFKLSDLMPNAWFHKLKNMKKPITNLPVDDAHKPKNPSPPPSTVTPSNTFSSSSSSTPSSSLSSLSSSRTSLYFKRDPIISSILKSPRKSARRSRSSNRAPLSSPRRRPVNAGTGCPCHHLFEDSTDRLVKINNTNKEPTRKDSTFIEIPPIVTRKAPKSNDTRPRATPTKRVSVSSPGVKLRTHSPRMMVPRRSDNIPPPRWRGRSRSLAVVKSSMNPQRDFKESMVEMILVNDIKGGKNLEDLLACYLELNSDGYHDLIINVFKQIWFDLNLKM